jgi:1-deoxy-D-xylulose-5-phosphate reductoisomerase
MIASMRASGRLGERAEQESGRLGERAEQESGRLGERTDEDAWPRRVVILGSTGSIGRQAVDVVRALPDRFRVVALVAGRDANALAAQAAELEVRDTGLGPDAALRLAAHPEADIVLNAIVGAAGLRASLVALEAGKRLALANKESLVAGGDLCRAAAQRGGGSIVPVDSEHAALAQCLDGRDEATVERIVLTASGGPFRERRDLSAVTPRQALAHPTWAMGPKVTIDSATLMNKGLEVIEAHHLFGFPYGRIGTVVHPQSIVHALIELADGTTLLQAAATDMRIPIAWSLSAPYRFKSVASRVDLSEVSPLEFESVDEERFPCVALARRAGAAGRTYPAALNAANEVAVAGFLGGRLSFLGIPSVIETVLASHEPGDPGDLSAVLEADRDARIQAEKLVANAPIGAS